MDRIEDQRITLWKGVASLFGYAATSLGKSDRDLSSIRTLIFSGERLPTHHLQTWMQALPHVKYYNGYGPTETTGISCCYWVDREFSSDEAIPIGMPCKNTNIWIMADDQPVDEPQKIGELAIGGPGLAKGYWRDQEKTARSFVDSMGGFDFGADVLCALSAGHPPGWHRGI